MTRHGDTAKAGSGLRSPNSLTFHSLIQAHLFLLKLKGKDTTTSAGTRETQGKSQGDVTSDQLDTTLEKTGGFSDLYLSAATFFASLKYIISVTLSS